MLVNDARWLPLAARQDHLISRAQLEASGIHPRSIDRRVDAGLLDVPHPGVYALRDLSWTFRRRARAATMWAGEGAVASHTTACRLLGLDGRWPETVHVTIPYGRGKASGDGVVVHRSQILPAIDRTQRVGFPCSNATRAIIDAAAYSDSDDLHLAFERAWHRGLLVPTHFVRRATTLAGRGRAGSGKVRAIVETLDQERRALESALEQRMWTLIVAAGLPRPTRQHSVEIDGEVYRLDLAWLDAGVVAEGEGWEWHKGRLRWKRDRRRQRALASAGLLVVPVLWDDLELDPAAALRSIGNALVSRGVRIPSRVSRSLRLERRNRR
jgi:very-short-patch-repair endonuclease